MPKAPRSLMAAAALLAVATSMIVAQPASAAVAAPIIGMITNTTPAGQFHHPQRYGDGDIELLVANPKHIGVRFANVPPGSLSASEVDFERPDGQDLAVGTVVLPGRSRFEVRDLAFDATGTLTRFDIAFLYGGTSPVGTQFGEVRMGLGDQDVRLAATTLTWPQTPVGGTRVWAQEALHNAGTTEQLVGRAAISGPHQKDFTIGDDSCTGTTLAPGSTCTVQVGYSPLHGGPRFASLTLPLGAGHASAALTGTSPLGTSRLTVAGDSWISQGRTQTDLDGPLVLEAAGTSAGTSYFTSGQTYNDDPRLNRLDISAPFGQKLANGTFAVRGSDDRTAHLIQISRAERECNGTTGTTTISGLSVASDGTVDRGRITFTLACGNDTRPGPVTGELLWRQRSDVSAPRGPNSLSVTGTGSPVVSWGGSTATDVAAIIVRLVPGDGTGATPTSGTSIAYNGAGTKTLRGLPAGRRYTVVAWSLDTTGNVGGVLRRGFTT